MRSVAPAILKCGLWVSVTTSLCFESCKADKFGLQSVEVQKPLFIATTPFNASCARWENYREWIKIPALTEIVGLDTILCPRLIKTLEEEDWNHNVHADFRLNYFYSLDYLKGRVRDISPRTILGLYRNPDFHIETPPAAQFVFLGYDLIEEMTQISALTNCGGFPDAFKNEELNSFGLIGRFERAHEVRRLLSKLHPEEPHAQCEMYAVWKLPEIPL